MAWGLLLLPWFNASVTEGWAGAVGLSLGREEPTAVLVEEYDTIRLYLQVKKNKISLN